MLGFFCVTAEDTLCSQRADSGWKDTPFSYIHMKVVRVDNSPNDCPTHHVFFLSSLGDITSAPLQFFLPRSAGFCADALPTPQLHIYILSRNIISAGGDYLGER